MLGLEQGESREGKESGGGDKGRGEKRRGGMYREKREKESNFALALASSSCLPSLSLGRVKPKLA